MEIFIAWYLGGAMATIAFLLLHANSHGSYSMLAGYWASAIVMSLLWPSLLLGLFLSQLVITYAERENHGRS